MLLVEQAKEVSRMKKLAIMYAARSADNRVMQG